MEDAEHKRRQEDMEERLKWAKFIAENPDAFNAALKGISEAKLRADLDVQIKEDFAPEELTQEDYERLNQIQEEYIPEHDLQVGDKEQAEPDEWLNPFEKDTTEQLDNVEETTLSPEQQEELDWLNSSENPEPEKEQTEIDETDIEKEVQEKLKEQEEQREKDDYTR